TEDLGMLRVIPELEITSPGDPVEVEAITRLLCNNKKPSYMRINKACEIKIHSDKLILNGDEALKVLKGSSTAVLTTGAMLHSSYEFIKEHKKFWSLYSFPFLKNLKNEILLDIFNTHKTLITVEEHQLNGGFGSFILEKINDLEILGLIPSRPMCYRVGIPNKFISHAGTQEFLRMESGLNLNKFLDLE
ncbi:MAG TPA: transketolase C-terminal domain-containing protein, partial [Pseudobdellovibrionaceae bacterium]|nr:transketolase C-terminal domain-containing protein [Pseudobdellovibrionaceae bacterium]